MLPFCVTKKQQQKMRPKNNFPTVYVVYDFRHRATNLKKGVVDICVSFDRKRRYISTGVKIFPNEWNKRTLVVHNRMDCVQLNERISAVKKRVDDYITECINETKAFSFEDLALYLDIKESRGVSFIDWMEKEINEDETLCGYTKKSYNQLVSYLRRYGGIVRFADITGINAEKFVNHLHKLGLKQQTIHGLYKVLVKYTNIARKRGIINGDPLLGVSVPRGKSEQGRWLTEDELHRMETTKILSPLDKVRDVFLVQCYTGLAYTDLMTAVSPENIQERNGMKVLAGTRHKTDELYIIPLVPECVAILERYGYCLPYMTLQQYNMRIKAVADMCGIDKPIASHWGRRTCGMVLLNHGISIEVVAKILGHANIRTTQACYAKILDNTVIEAIKGLGKEE